MQRKPGQVSLERALSKLGIASRTVARKWIEEGLVEVNGKTIVNPGFPVNPEKAKIKIQGAGEAVAAQWRTVMLHKPKGLVTTRSDEKGRPTVFEAIKEIKEHLSPVGRLDQATSGLLLFTNDTRFAAWLTDPKNEIVREYIVTVRGEVTLDEAKAMKKGITDAGEKLAALEVKVLKASAKESELLIKLTEGKNREIRRLCFHFNHEVTRLKRVSFGALKLDALDVGKWKDLTKEELRHAFPEADFSRALCK
jgi:23S rRNA pseudouridine2605 synthase